MCCVVHVRLMRSLLPVCSTVICLASITLEDVNNILHVT